jgi:hypothetical protein
MYHADAAIPAGYAWPSPFQAVERNRQPVRVGIECLADQIVGDARAVVLSRVDLIDSGGYRGLENADGPCAVR